MTETMKFRPVMLVPGLLAWGLIIPGIVMEDTLLIGMGVAVMVVFMAITITKKLRASAKSGEERKLVWQQGRAATARIVSIGTRGGGMNGNPVINFELEVTLEGDVSYLARTSVMISKLAIPRIQPETEIVVRVDPNDRNIVVIDEKLTPYGYK